MDALISTGSLAAEIGSPDLRVFDCTVHLRRSDDGTFRTESGRRAFTEAHVPGSGFLDQVDELSDPRSDLRFTAPDPAGLAVALGSRGIGPRTRVVLYDRAFNMWATRVWWLLRSIGFDSAAVLDGGWRAWTDDGRPVSTGQGVEHEPVELAPDPRPGLVVGRAEVESATTDDAVCLLNALSPQVHDGTDESYGRPGHIPSSRNVYAVDLVDPATHRYRPLDELRAMFDRAGVRGDRIITWCGGGIAATSDAFVLSLLGHDDVGVYDGSLSEWVAAGLPLEV